MKFVHTLKIITSTRVSSSNVIWKADSIRSVRRKVSRKMKMNFKNKCIHQVKKKRTENRNRSRKINRHFYFRKLRGSPSLSESIYFMKFVMTFFPYDTRLSPIICLVIDLWSEFSCLHDLGFLIFRYKSPMYLWNSKTSIEDRFMSIQRISWRTIQRLWISMEDYWKEKKLHIFLNYRQDFLEDTIQQEDELDTFRVGLFA